MIHAKETYSESCEFPQAPQNIFKTFSADIFETPQIFQTVICYPTYLDGEVVDCEVKIPIYVKPCAIRDDVEAALYQEYGLMLGNLKFSMAPKEFSI